MKVAVSGHRPPKVPMYSEQIMTALQNEFLRIGAKHVFTGGAIGVDLMAAEVALKLGLKHTLCIPFDGYNRFWREQEEFARLEMIKTNPLTNTVLVNEGKPPQGDEGKEWVKKVLNDRNMYMVDNTDCLIAVWNGSKGGTANCFAYGEETQQKRVYKLIRIPPQHIGLE